MSPFKRFLFILKFIEIRLRFVAILVVTALVVGYWDHVQNYYERWQRQRAGSKAETPTESSGVRSSTEFFCPMHTFVVRDAMGKCPVCGMDLISRKRGEKQTLPEGVLARVQASPERIAEAGIKIETIGYRPLVRTVRAYGEIEPDETRQTRIIARFEGRMDELLVRATGETIAEGQPLARIYSPKFLAASEEFLQALKAERRLAGDPAHSEEERQRSSELTALARQRLHLAGFSERQLNELAERGKAEHTITLDAPFSGVVLERSVLQGDMVADGTPLFTLADLSRVWVQARVPEADLGLVQKDMPVEIETVAHPGRSFFGTVDFISPAVDPASRTARVRIVVPNPKMELKPGMAATVQLRAPFGKFEKVAEGATRPPKPSPPKTDLYYCPMHPEVVSDKPGQCQKCGGMELVKKPSEKTEGAAASVDYTCPMHPEIHGHEPGDCPKCGMALVPAVEASADLDPWSEGYTCPMHPDRFEKEPGKCPWCDCGMTLALFRFERPLAVPEESVIDTGTRKIVYLESAPGVFDAKQVSLGPLADGFYPVIAGLTPGERIAARGAFLIDAENRLNPQ